MGRLLLLLFCLPADAFGLLLAFVGTLGSRPIWQRRTNVLIVRPAPGSFVARYWRYSTTLGHVVVWHPEHDEAVLAHELVHVLQAEACCVAWWLLTVLS